MEDDALDAPHRDPIELPGARQHLEMRRRDIIEIAYFVEGDVINLAAQRCALGLGLREKSGRPSLVAVMQGHHGLQVELILGARRLEKFRQPTLAVELLTGLLGADELSEERGAERDAGVLLLQRVEQAVGAFEIAGDTQQLGERATAR